MRTVEAVVVDVKGPPVAHVEGALFYVQVVYATHKSWTDAAGVKQKRVYKDKRWIFTKDRPEMHSRLSVTFL